jgi:hypothetical protein
MLEISKIRSISRFVNKQNLNYNNVFYTSIFVNNFNTKQNEFEVINYNITELIRYYSKYCITNDIFPKGYWKTVTCPVDTAIDGLKGYIDKPIVLLKKFEKEGVVFSQRYKWPLI